MSWDMWAYKGGCMAIYEGETTDRAFNNPALPSRVCELYVCARKNFENQSSATKIPTSIKYKIHCLEFFFFLLQIIKD